MSIDTSGKFWVGSDPEDIRGFLEAYAEEEYKVHQFRIAKCQCGSGEFQLDADDIEGVARRTCAKCQNIHFICDSGEFWEGSNPVHLKCVKKGCGCEICNVGVGFSVYPDSATGIKWIYVGVRCSKCGMLGCFAGWKVAQDDVEYLFDQA